MSGTVEQTVLKLRTHAAKSGLLHGIKRLLTYSPIALWREHLALRGAERNWRGNILCCLPYLNTGGAEQVHADILSTIADQRPLIVICGFSENRAFAYTYGQCGTLVELPRLLNHPFTAASAHRRLARLLDAQVAPVLFSSLTSAFFDLLPLIRPGIRTYYLQHAFLYQPEGNVQHKLWLRHFQRVDGYIFISQRSKGEYERFLFMNNIPQSHFGKLQFISNAVQHFGSVKTHERTGVLFVGRNSPEKRLDLFLALCDRLEAEAPVRFRFTVVGADPVAGHPRVQFKGRVNDHQALSAIYQQHDLLALTSTREGFPLVIMEAMANGLAVLSTPVGDVPERLGADHAIVTSNIEDDTVLREMAHAAMALDHDRDRLQRMKASALQKAKSEFAPQQFRERYRALLLGTVD